MGGYMRAVGDMKFRFADGNAVIFGVEAFTDEAAGKKAFRNTGWKSTKHDNQAGPMFKLVDQVAKKRLMTVLKEPDSKLAQLLEDAKKRKTAIPEVRYVLEIDYMWQDENTDKYVNDLARQHGVTATPGAQRLPQGRKGLVFSDVTVVEVLTNLGLEPRDFVTISAKSAVASEGLSYVGSMGLWIKGVNRPTWLFDPADIVPPPSL